MHLNKGVLYPLWYRIPSNAVYLVAWYLTFLALCLSSSTSLVFRMKYVHDLVWCARSNFQQLYPYDRHLHCSKDGQFQYQGGLLPIPCFRQFVCPMIFGPQDLLYLEMFEMSMLGFYQG